MSRGGAGIKVEQTGQPSVAAEAKMVQGVNQFSSLSALKWMGKKHDGQMRWVRHGTESSRQPCRRG